MTLNLPATPACSSESETVVLQPEHTSSTHAALEPVLAAMRQRYPSELQEQATAFGAAFYQRMEADELPLHPAQTWAAIAAGVLEFVRVRPPTQLSRVHAFNPVLETDGWQSPHTVLQIVTQDMPFLVDTVSLALAEQGIGIHVLGHPVITVSRDENGALTVIGEGAAESVMLLEIDRQSSTMLENVAQVVSDALENVRDVVTDWQPMRERAFALANDLALRPLPVSEQARSEAQAFLRWMNDDHFTFLGYREYTVETQNDQQVLVAQHHTGLGLMRKRSRFPQRPIKGLAAQELNTSAGLDDALIVTKTNARSPVHRSGYMDYIGVLSFDENGQIIGEQRFLGLFTSSAWNQSPRKIPLVRQRHEAVMQRSGLDASSHSGKALRHIIESLPREELFQASSDELFTIATGVLGLRERVRSRLFLRQDRFSHFISVLVYLPRERFNTDVRLRIEHTLKTALHGDHVDSSVVLGDSPLAQLHVIVRPRSGHSLTLDSQALEQHLVQLLHNWHDDLREALITNYGESEGLRIATRIGKALPAGYIEIYSAELAATDAAELDALSTSEALRLRLHPLVRDGVEGLRLKLYRQHKDIALSDVLPLMENMGLRAIAEHPWRLEVEGTALYIQDFEVEPAVSGVDMNAVNAAFCQAFAKVWQGQAENDGFNRLISTAGLDWQQVAMLRAYCKYLLQTGVPFSQSYMENTFNRYPLLARLLVELFAARFEPKPANDPAALEQLSQQLKSLAGRDTDTLAILDKIVQARHNERSTRIQTVRNGLIKLLEHVSSLDEERILRSFISVIEATLRTSYYIQRTDGLRADGGPADYLSFKLDASKVPDLPKPIPYREIFVCGPRVEGTHLRFGPVARGGLRWSDRREDFRTEVLGLVKAQMVKNTVIVPVGSKGGFFAKQLPDPTVDRQAWLNEGIECYKRFINGLLDITDNIVDNRVIPPLNVVRHDKDDPYLVVAADKGTATFSDTANAIARAHGFWLDDAFASGGSVGYDHKGMGITARGAWESVKRHFRALGHDCQRQDFTVVGIGDMSGDVFGNGMLLSKHIRLVCAFDHRHIFLDPNPVASNSFTERQRLFTLPRSSWDDYSKELISEGGGVYARSLKSINITPQVRHALGIAEDVETLAPNELIRAALRAPVDLLWNGGIGTYVKSSAQSHDEVGDRANNAVRVNGAELRCKIVGEGGNLGMTQSARIEAAQHGVLLNTDFIDNSAGVDTSDHEVNIKILLGAAVQAGKIDIDQRNNLLASMTNEVASLVLQDNYRQNQALSLMQRMGSKRLGSKQHFVRTLEQQGLLDRQIEFLPQDSELAARKQRGQGLTRPELAVLLSYAKIVAFDQILASDIPEDPYLSRELQRYFPAPLQNNYAPQMQQHRLKREIIATAVTNQTINRMGATFLLRMQEDSGRNVAEIAKAFTISRETLNARGLWDQIDALDGHVPESVQIDALEVIWKLQWAFVRWLLNCRGPVPGISTAVARYQSAFNAIRTAPGVLPDSQRSIYEASIQQWQEKGVPASLAQQLSELLFLEPALDIIELALACKREPADVAKVYLRLGESLHLPWLFSQINALEVSGRWHAIARNLLRHELAAHQHHLAAQVLAGKHAAPQVQVNNWLAREDNKLHFVLGMLQELVGQKSLDYPTISVAVHRLGQLANPM